MAEPDQPVLSLCLLQLFMNQVWDWHQSWGALLASTSSVAPPPPPHSQPLGPVLSYFMPHCHWLPKVGGKLLTPTFNNLAMLWKNLQFYMCSEEQWPQRGEDAVWVLLLTFCEGNKNKATEQTLLIWFCSKSMLSFPSSRLPQKCFALDPFGGCSLTTVKEAVYFAADLHWLNDILTSWLKGSTILLHITTKPIKIK